MQKRWELYHSPTRTLFSKRFVKSSSSRRFSSCSLWYLFWPFFVCYRLVRVRFECIIIFTRIYITCFLDATYRLDFDAFKFVLTAFFSVLLTFRVRYVSAMEYTYLELIFSFPPVNLTIFFLPRTDSVTEGQVSAQTREFLNLRHRLCHVALLWARRHSYQRGGLTAIK